MSRLAAVKEAVTTQIERMAHSTPNRTVTLLAFDSDLHLYNIGKPGQSTLQRIREHDVNFNSAEQLIQRGRSQAIQQGRKCPIELCKAEALRKLQELQPRGCTALGMLFFIHCQQLGLTQ